MFNDLLHSWISGPISSEIRPLLVRRNATIEMWKLPFKKYVAHSLQGF